MTSQDNHDNYCLLSIEHFFTSIIGGYLHTKFEVFSISQSWVMAHGPQGYKVWKGPGR